MATRTAGSSNSSSHGSSCRVITWTGLLNGDDGEPVKLVFAPDRSIQFFGTFGTGGTIVLEGSNNGTNYVVLTDPQGNNISKTAEGIEMVTELTLWVRPRVTGGDGTTSLTAILLARG